ncbi:MAG: hypothetical protein V4472_23375 [Pseudomonadota bacterium]
MSGSLELSTDSKHESEGIARLATASEAAAALSHSTYTGTVESADIQRLANASEAASALSHSTYTGTVESADLAPDR